MTSPGAAVSVDRLTVRRGGRAVVRDVSFALPRGGVTGLLGPSACGKTTVMRCLVGVQAAVTGTVTVLSRPAGVPALRAAVGYVTQTPAVYRDLTVEENLRYFAAICRAGSEQVERVINEVDLASRRRQLVASLSGGERARVSLATALLGSPQVLILDEPTVGLDPVLRRDLWQLFIALAAAGTSLLVSSHVMDEAERCKDLLLMRDGQLIAHDTPAGLLNRTGASSVEAAFLHLVATP